jgi:hypothetical protein
MTDAHFRFSFINADPSVVPDMLIDLLPAIDGRPQSVLPTFVHSPLNLSTHP